jgi:hypothetical protein
MNNTTSVVDIKRRTTTDICERLRAIQIADRPRTEYDRNRHHLMLSILDVAQHKGRLALYLDCRSMAYAAGLDEHTASSILTYLSETENDHGATKLVNYGRVYPRHANLYIINPVFPHVCKFLPPREGKTHPRVEGVNVFGDFGVNASMPELWLILGLADQAAEAFAEQVNPARRTLQQWFETEETYTHGGEAEALLIGRKERGVSLGKTNTAVCLALGDWRRVVDIAGEANVSVPTARKCLRDIAASRGLAVSSMAEFVGSGQRLLWKAGYPLDEWEPGTDIVGTRLRRWEKERRLRKLDFPTGDETAQSKERHPSTTVPVCYMMTPFLPAAIR